MTPILAAELSVSVSVGVRKTKFRSVPGLGVAVAMVAGESWVRQRPLVDIDGLRRTGKCRRGRPATRGQLAPLAFAITYPSAATVSINVCTVPLVNRGVARNALSEKPLLYVKS